jgi:hypothetical protein
MTTATIIIKDNGNEIQIEGHLEPANAIDLPPTPAVIIGSYLAANMERVCKDAMTWMNQQTIAPLGDEPGIPTSILIDGGR